MTTPELRIEEYTKDGKRGVIVRQPNGHFAPGTQSHAPITRENARQMHEKNVELHRQAAADAIYKEAVETGLIDADAIPAAAWGVLVKRVWQQIMDSDKPRGDDMLAVGRAIGAIVPVGVLAHSDDNATASSWMEFLRGASVSITRLPGDSVIDVLPTDTLDLSALTPEQRDAIDKILHPNE